MNKKTIFYALFTVMLMLFSSVSSSAVNMTFSPDPSQRVESLPNYIPITFTDLNPLGCMGTATVTVLKNDVNNDEKTPAGIGASNDQKGYQIINKYGEITEAGKYTYKVSSGLMVYDAAQGMVNIPAFEVTYYVGIDIPSEEPTFNVTFSPDPSVPVESLTEFTISFPDVQVAGIIPSGTVTILKDGEVTTSEVVTLSQKNSDLLVKSKYGEITNPGVYTFQIPANAITIYPMNGDPISVPALEVTYTVGSAVEPEPEPEPTDLFVPVSITPTDGSAITSLSVVDLKFSHDLMYFQPGVSRADAAIVYDADRNQVATGYMSNPSSDYYTVRFTINPIITEPGEYTVVVQSGRFNYNNDTSNTNPEYRFTYTIEEPEPTFNVTFSPDPSVPVDELGMITIKFPEYSNHYIIKNSSDVTLYKDGGEFTDVTLTLNTGTGEAYIFITPAIKESGEYKFVISENVFAAMNMSTYAQEPLPGFEVTYTVEAPAPIYGYIYVNDQLEKGKLTLSADGLYFAEEETGEFAITRSTTTFNKRFAYSIIGEKQASYDITYTWEDETVKQSTFELIDEQPDGYISFEGDTITGINGIDADNAPVEYYNLQGIRVANPENGLFIRRQGNKTEKIYIKGL